MGTQRIALTKVRSKARTRTIPSAENLILVLVASVVILEVLGCAVVIRGTGMERTEQRKVDTRPVTEDPVRVASEDGMMVLQRRRMGIMTWNRSYNVTTAEVNSRRRIITVWIMTVVIPEEVQMVVTEGIAVEVAEGALGMLVEIVVAMLVEIVIAWWKIRCSWRCRVRCSSECRTKYAKRCCALWGDRWGVLEGGIGEATAARIVAKVMVAVKVAGAEAGNAGGIVVIEETNSEAKGVRGKARGVAVTAGETEKETEKTVEEEADETNMIPGADVGRRGEGEIKMEE
jgi:hypothetical protein